MENNLGTVLSLFDGISCGQVALERAGLKVDAYYASEIDPYAIKITQKNYPNTIQLGDVSKVRGSDLPKIDLLIGGSPCQGLSRAKYDRTNLEDPRSKLFYEYIRIKDELNPRYFLLENVEMDSYSESEFTRLTGVDPIPINSNLVSAQNRKRLYWTNIPSYRPPEDKGILLKDILINGNYPIFDFSNFSPHETKNYYQFDVSGKGYKSQQDRVFKTNGKFGCFPNARAITKRKIFLNEYTYRDLSLNECETLQNLPYNYTLLDEGFSLNQSLSAIGNGWTVDIIVHLLSGIQRRTP